MPSYYPNEQVAPGTENSGRPLIVLSRSPYAGVAYEALPNGGVSALTGYASEYPHVVRTTPDIGYRRNLVVVDPDYIRQQDALQSQIQADLVAALRANYARGRGSGGGGGGGGGNGKPAERKVDPEESGKAWEDHMLRHHADYLDPKGVGASLRVPAQQADALHTRWEETQQLVDELNRSSQSGDIATKAPSEAQNTSAIKPEDLSTFTKIMRWLLGGPDYYQEARARSSNARKE